MALAVVAAVTCTLLRNRTLLLLPNSPHQWKTLIPPNLNSSFLSIPHSSTPSLLRRRLYCTHRRNVVEILEERGLLDSLTSDALRDSKIASLRAYCSFDCAAESLHIGNLLGIIVLSWFLRCGHRAVALVSGRGLEKNVSAISDSLQGILGRVSSTSLSSDSFAVMNNCDWWNDMTMLDFLSVGRFVRVAAMMMSRDGLESEQGLSLTEFSYQLLQAYDFLHLFRDHGVNVQIGGSDQWGNITAGTDLIRRKLKVEGAYGLTFPLLLKADGTKFGKSEEGAVWLSPSLLSPHQFYRYFCSVPDADVVRFLKILTFLSIDEISQIEKEMQGPEYVPNSAQRRLAKEVTRFVHGEEGLREALKATGAVESIVEDGPSSIPHSPILLRRNVVEILEERGLLDALTSDALRDPKTVPLRVYCGFDPTAESLHIGNLLGIIVLSWFLRCGHNVVALVGGATGRVGDPSGKSLERPELDALALDKNVSAISASLQGILGRVSSTSFGSFAVVNNYDWWKDMKQRDFLENVGRFVRVGTMMSKDSVRKRLESEQGMSYTTMRKILESEQGMSYTEFIYPLLQGYDFLRLFRDHGVNVQIGGSDQRGNITVGTDLIRRILKDEGAYALTFPLLIKSDGTKFGKSEEGVVWLSPSRLSSYQFYQYFFSVCDADVVRFLKSLTFLNIDEISQIEKEMQGPKYVPNSAQRRLAEEVTRFVHGEEGLREALKATQALRPGAQTELDSKTIESIAEDVPSFSLRHDQVLNLSLLDLSVSTGLLDSKSAARRLLKQGGFYLNNNRVDSEAKRIEADDIVDGKVILLSAGKKNKMIVRIAD